jgi:PAS domain S-box-containing protein
LERFVAEVDEVKTAQRPEANNELPTGPIGRRADELAQLLAHIVNSSDNAIVSKDLNSKIRSWNQAAERIFGYSPEEAVSKSNPMLISPELQHEEKSSWAMSTDPPPSKDEVLIDISLTVSPVRDATGRIVRASKITRDITEQSAREQMAADLRAMILLRELGIRSLRKDIFINQGLQDFVEAAIVIAKADKGNLQLFDSGLGTFIIAAQCGFLR